MEVFLTIFLSALLIMLVVISPLPSLPVLIMNYTVNGMINGFIAFYFGFIGAITCHYYIGVHLKSIYSKISNNNSIIGNLFFRYKYVKNISKKVIKTISILSAFEFLLLRLSALLPFKLVNIASGVNKRPFFEYILLTVIAQAPYQLIYYSASSQSYLVDKYSEFLGFEGYQALLAKVSLCSLIALLMMIGLRFFTKRLGLKYYKITK